MIGPFFTVQMKKKVTEGLIREMAEGALAERRSCFVSNGSRAVL
jgi:hypothetical protein